LSTRKRLKRKRGGSKTQAGALVTGKAGKKREFREDASDKIVSPVQVTAKTFPNQIINEKKGRSEYFALQGVGRIWGGTKLGADPLNEGGCLVRKKNVMTESAGSRDSVRKGDTGRGAIISIGLFDTAVLQRQRKENTAILHDFDSYRWVWWGGRKKK